MLGGVKLFSKIYFSKNKDHHLTFMVEHVSTNEATNKCSNIGFLMVSLDFRGSFFLVEHFFGGLTSDVSSPENPMNEAPKTSSECDLQASNYSLYNLASKKQTGWWF